MWALLVIAQLALPLAPARPECKARCYQQKSVDYQKCRMVPPTRREERSACFVRADATLERCLRGC